MKRWIPGVVTLLLAAGIAIGQYGGGAKSYVTYAPEPANVDAKKPATVDLNFRVLDGYHMNSNKPKSELLIPTVLKLDPAPGVKVNSIEYPQGHEYSFSFSPKEKLDVYSGPIAIKLHVTAQPGTHTLKGVLGYQACDNAACYPPKKLPVEVTVNAK